MPKCDFNKVVLQICCIFSEHFFQGTALDGCFSLEYLCTTITTAKSFKNINLVFLLEAVKHGRNFIMGAINHLIRSCLNESDCFSLK